jgi:phosphoribosylglycinamide formyltransferase-1
MNNIVLFASGSGTNVENIVNFFKNDPETEISLVLTNNPEAYVIQRAEKLGIPVRIFNRDDFYKNNAILTLLKNINPDLIVLAGFLWLIPADLIKAFPDRIINIHPALLPKYGGKGMYGSRVHEAVVKNKEKESGITIHYVNEKYDEGNIIFQAKCEVLPSDSPEDVAQKVHKLEYEHFPKVIAKLLHK